MEIMNFKLHHKLTFEKDVICMVLDEEYPYYFVERDAILNKITGNTEMLYNITIVNTTMNDFIYLNKLIQDRLTQVHILNTCYYMPAKIPEYASKNNSLQNKLDNIYKTTLEKAKNIKK